MRNGVSIRHIDVLSQGWIKLRRYTFDYRRRDGRTETLVREVHDHGHGVAVLPYDAERDFAGVSLVATAPTVLVVHPSIPAYSVKDLVALAKAKPGALNYGSAEIGRAHV